MLSLLLLKRSNYPSNIRNYIKILQQIYLFL